jgi:hypothetical protein
MPYDAVIPVLVPVPVAAAIASTLFDLAALAVRVPTFVGARRRFAGPP